MHSIRQPACKKVSAMIKAVWSWSSHSLDKRSRSIRGQPA
jgi:hypothetical protein